MSVYTAHTRRRVKVQSTATPWRWLVVVSRGVVDRSFFVAIAMTTSQSLPSTDIGILFSTPHPMNGRPEATTLLPAVTPTVRARQAVNCLGKPNQTSTPHRAPHLVIESKTRPSQKEGMRLLQHRNSKVGCCWSSIGDRSIRSFLISYGRIIVIVRRKHEYGKCKLQFYSRY